jgi:hypothetical protein
MKRYSCIHKVLLFKYSRSYTLFHIQLRNVFSMCSEKQLEIVQSIAENVSEELGSRLLGKWQV